MALGLLDARNPQSHHGRAARKPRSRPTARARPTCATASSRTRRAATARRCACRSRSRTRKASPPTRSISPSCASARGASPMRAPASARCSSSPTCAFRRCAWRRSRCGTRCSTSIRTASPEPTNGCNQAAGHCARALPALRRDPQRARPARAAGRARRGRGGSRARAHDASRAAGDRASSPTPFACWGSAHCSVGDAAAARTHLEQALALDREIGAPRKIALDLLALGRAAALGGERDAARAYYARAMAVSEADRDNAGVAEARALLEAATGK